VEFSLPESADQVRNGPPATCSAPTPRGPAVPQARFDSDAKARNGRARFGPDAKVRNERTREAGYAQRLQRLEGARWKQVLKAQAPYRWNIRRLNLGYTLDVGCGIGRNLRYLQGNGVGVDHNPTAVDVAREAGLSAFTPEEFLASEHARAGGFDSMLLAHVLEHLPEDDVREVVGGYLPYVRSGGSVVFITPQERGYASDSTHVRFVGFAESTALATEFGLTVDRRYSFPLPRFAGRAFTYNEFVVVSRKL
jgi:SAM-dependent methyltransferase